VNRRLRDNVTISYKHLKNVLKDNEATLFILATENKGQSRAAWRFMKEIRKPFFYDVMTPH